MRKGEGAEGAVEDEKGARGIATWMQEEPAYTGETSGRKWAIRRS